MAHLLWSTDLSIGSEALDSDHRALLSLVRRLDDAVCAGEAYDVISSLLTVALELTLAHSEREELVARRLGRPVCPEHDLAHRRFTDWMESVRDDFVRGRDIDRVRAVLPVIVDWWRHHVLDLDMAEKDLFSANAGRIDDILADCVLAEPILDSGPLRWAERPQRVLGLLCED